MSAAQPSPKGESLKNRALTCALVAAAIVAAVLPISPRAVAAACAKGTVVVRPSQDLVSVVKSKGPGTRFCVLPGTYRLKSAVVPKPGQRLIFKRGAVLSGARVISEWTRDGPAWFSGGQTQSIRPYGTPCDMNAAACEYEDLFMDGQPLRRVLTRSELTSGTFFFDESADRMYVADDPNGHRMEAPITATAIEGRGANGVIVKGATIEMFGLHGIVASARWTIRGTDIRYVHSHGLRVWDGARVISNRIHHAGNMGVFAQGSDMTFRRNELHHNNYLNFGKESGYWHAGAAKVARSSDVLVEANHSHQNVGDGWWFDTDNIDVTIRDNVFSRNVRYGLLYEASQRATITDNRLVSNGTQRKWWGAGIWVSTSRDVEIARNVFDRNVYSSLALGWTDRGSSSRFGERRLADLDVHHNVFKMSEGFVGVAYGDPRIYTSNNRFRANRYLVTDKSGRWWWWDGAKDWLGWRAAGHDADGGLSLLP